MEGLRYFKRKKPGDEGVVATVRAVRTDQIAPDPTLPADVCSNTDLQMLADSIRRRGIIEPLIIREADYDEKEKKICGNGSGSEIALVSERVYDPQAKKPLYYVISGEKRLRAARLIGLESVPCLLIECNHEEAAELTCVLRMTRPKRHPLDDTALLMAWMRNYGIGRTEAAKILCLKEREIGSLLSFGHFSALEKEVMRLAEVGTAVMAALTAVPDAQMRAGLLGKIAEEGLSVLQVKKLVDRLLKPKSVSPAESKGVVRDVRLFSNTFDRAVTAMRALGLQVDYEKSVEKGSAGFLILIKSENVSCETFSEPDS